MLTLLLTPGQQHETTVLAALLERGLFSKEGPGRPRMLIPGDRAPVAQTTRNSVVPTSVSSVSCHSDIMAAGKAGSTGYWVRQALNPPSKADALNPRV